MSERHKIHMIGNAHIDPVWLWSWQEGFAEIKATFASALERMKEFPDFIFTCACASYYKWVEENCPEMFEEIKQRVSEGRWEIVGGWWLQPDCNMPCGESYVRHSLYGQRYFLEKFGRIARVGYNVDSFGHSGMLPQILVKSGMNFYVFMRPDIVENNELKKNLFWWESPDGSRVMSFIIPTCYGPWGWKGMPESDDPNAHIERIKILETSKLCNEQNLNIMGFYGVGNHGGGPTIANINLIHDMQKELEEDVIFSSPNRYFDEMSSLNLQIPVHKKDLQIHAKGCYSALWEVKKNNRVGETRLLSAEKFAAAAHGLFDMKYPGTKIQSAWEQVMFNQFHDTICGCSIKDAYQDSRESYGEALNIGATVLNAAVQKISWAVNTSGSRLSKEKHWALWEYGEKGSPLVVFNPLAWDVKTPITVNKDVKGITDENGIPVEIQKNAIPPINLLGEFETLFIAELPPMGYRTYWLHLEREYQAEPLNGSLHAEETVLENDFLRVEFEPHTGYISRMYDKKNAMEILNGKGCVPLVIDMSRWDTWAHGALEFRDVMARFADAELRLIEKGPLRTKLRVTSIYNRSKLIQDFILYRDSAEIEVQVKLDWHERVKMLKLSFPVNVTEGQATWEIPYGYIEKPANGEEIVALRWMNLTGQAVTACSGGTGAESPQRPPTARSPYGLSILNDYQYSSDIMGNDMRLTLVNSPVYADHSDKIIKDAEVMDQGMQEFRYKIVPYAGDWREAGIVKKAYENITPAIQVHETYHEGPLPQCFSGIRIDNPNIIADVFKKAEDEDGYILRCYESSGADCETEIEIPFLERKWLAAFGKCEIKTFFIPRDAKKTVAEMNLLETYI